MRSLQCTTTDWNMNTLNDDTCSPFPAHLDLRVSTYPRLAPQSMTKSDLHTLDYDEGVQANQEGKVGQWFFLDNYSYCANL